MNCNTIVCNIVISVCIACLICTIYILFEEINWCFCVNKQCGVSNAYIGYCISSHIIVQKNNVLR